MASEHERLGRHAPLQRPVLGPLAHALEAGAEAAKVRVDSRQGPSGTTASARYSLGPVEVVGQGIACNSIGSEWSDNYSAL